MRRARWSGVMVGLVAVLVNVALVVGLVVWLQGSPDLSAGDPSSSTPPSTPSDSSSSTSVKPTFERPSTVLKQDKDPFVVVLGGDEGAGEGGWVQRMATVAAERPRTVSFSALEPQDPTKYAEATRTGEGRSLEIRNGSLHGSSIRYAAHRVRFLVPRSADVVVISYHPGSTKGLDRDLSDLLKRVRERVPKATVALVLHPRGVNGSGQEVREGEGIWAERNGVPTIDVNRAFAAAEGQQLRSEWADSHLTLEGADLWARTVLKALIGKDPPASSSTSSTPSTEPVAPVEPTTETTTEPSLTATEPESTSVAPVPPVTQEPTYAPPPQPTSTYVPPPQPTSTYVPPAPPTSTDDPPTRDTETSSETSRNASGSPTGLTGDLSSSETVDGLRR